MQKSYRHTPELRQVVDGFWEVIPPLWRSIQAHIRQAAIERYQIREEQFHLLRHIRRGQNSVSLLAQTRGISRPAVSQSVDLLVRRGLVIRTVDEHDRRHIRLDLSPSGSDLMESLLEDTRLWLMGRFASLPPHELQELIRSFESLRLLIKE
jgi:DNA-binding MarR family transcriptional regulator